MNGRFLNHRFWLGFGDFRHHHIIGPGGHYGRSLWFRLRLGCHLLLFLRLHGGSHQINFHTVLSLLHAVLRLLREKQSSACEYGTVQSR
ncbi:MAG: hypothetical protein SFY92_08950 [Verrucomicrobiae bacterium]|nr:hypothetical protein [Verrucomicrobiae bacterium]